MSARKSVTSLTPSESLTARITAVHAILTAEYPALEVPSVTKLSHEMRSPYRALVSTLISLRTKDEVTLAASERLFSVADTPQAMLMLAAEEIERLIYPASFFRNKARTILDVSTVLMQQFGGQVPSDIDTLLSLKGVGRKTANLVLVEGYGIPAICVDTHVHRICNRLGILHSKNPDETEMILRQILPPDFWITWNEMLVAWGRHICNPVSPRCSACKIEAHCAKVGVQRRR